MDIVPSLAPPPTTLVRTYLALLLHTEVALLLRTPLNVTWFYPTWVRMALKKGLLKVDSDGRQLDVAAQLQQKRTKVSVCVCISIFTPAQVSNGSYLCSLPYSFSATQSLPFLTLLLPNSAPRSPVQPSAPCLPLPPPRPLPWRSQSSRVPCSSSENSGGWS